MTTTSFFHFGLSGFETPKLLAEREQTLLSSFNKMKTTIRNTHLCRVVSNVDHSDNEGSFTSALESD